MFITCTYFMHIRDKHKKQCVIWSAESESVLRLQRDFRRLCGRGPTVGKAIRRWFNGFKWRRIVERSKPPPQPRTSLENVERVTIKMSWTKGKVACLRSSSFARNKKKYGYTGAEFVNLTLKAFYKGEKILRRVIYTDEANYHKNGHVKWNTSGAWRQKRRYDIYEHAWDSSKVNVRCSKTRDFVIGPLIIAEQNICS
jgi:hypothetical protein